MPKSNHELALEIQELRQFCAMLILHLGAHLPQDYRDYWWEKLGSYPEVSKDVPVCCGGGPQWGHAMDCKTLP